MVPRQYVVQRDLDQVELVVRLSRATDVFYVVVGVILFSLPPLTLPIALAWPSCAAILVGGIAWLRQPVTHRLAIRGHRVTWDGQEVDHAWVLEDQVEIDGVPLRLVGRLTPQALTLIRDALANAEAQRLADPPPAPEALTRLVDAAGTAERPNPRR